MKSKIYNIMYIDSDNKVNEGMIKESKLVETLADIKSNNLTLISLTLKIG